MHDHFTHIEIQCSVIGYIVRYSGTRTFLIRQTFHFVSQDRHPREFLIEFLENLIEFLIFNSATILEFFYHFKNSFNILTNDIKRLQEKLVSYFL